jgi:hypothetical protein
MEERTGPKAVGLGGQGQEHKESHGLIPRAMECQASLMTSLMFSQVDSIYFVENSFGETCFIVTPSLLCNDITTNVIAPK